MRRGTVFDPRYISHVQPTIIGTMRARADIFRPNSTRPDWEPGIGNTGDTYTQIWAGACRVQPNIDWRARVREFQGEFDATLAVRFDLPMHRNEFGAIIQGNDDIVEYADDPEFAMGDRIIITKLGGPGQRTLLNKVYTVRNAMPSTTMFQHNLLCDVGTSLHG